MKNYKLIINLLICFVFIVGIIAFGLLIYTTFNHWYVFNNIYKGMLDTVHSDKELFLKEYSDYLSETLCLTFSVIFSALSTLASAVTFCLLNFKVWKNKD